MTFWKSRLHVGTTDKRIETFGGFQAASIILREECLEFDTLARRLPKHRLTHPRNFSITPIVKQCVCDRCDGSL